MLYKRLACLVFSAGAKNASMLALQAGGPEVLNGVFVQNCEVSEW
jgi:hypothetical protein